jgi:hypothetical protein
MRRCFFCGRRLRHEAADDHHVIPQRYFRDYPGEDPHIGNVARVHVTCHRIFNSQYDRISLPLEEYAAYMETIDWGFHLLAQGVAEPAYLAAD